MQRRSSPAWRILRWCLFLPTVVALALAALVLTILVLDALEDLLACVSGDVPGNGRSRVLGSRVAPSGRRWVILLASGLLVMGLAFLLSLTAEGDREARGLAASGVGGVAAGAVVALRRARARPHHVSRRSEGRSLRYKGTAPFQYIPVDRRTFFGRDREAPFPSIEATCPRCVG